MSGTFQFPKHYNLPPFFTTQPVVETRQKQAELWGQLILDWCQHHKKFEMDVQDATKWPLFNNTKLKRKLSPSQIQFFLDYLASQGNVEWKDKAKTKAAIYFRTPLQWGTIIYNWAMDMGKASTVVTLYEITQGEDAEDQEFYELDSDTLVKALKALETQGKAQLFSGSSASQMGVKFFTV